MKKFLFTSVLALTLLMVGTTVVSAQDVAGLTPDNSPLIFRLSYRLTGTDLEMIKRKISQDHEILHWSTQPLSLTRYAPKGFTPKVFLVVKGQPQDWSDKQVVECLDAIKTRAGFESYGYNTFPGDKFEIVFAYGEAALKDYLESVANDPKFPRRLFVAPKPVVAKDTTVVKKKENKPRRLKIGLGIGVESFTSDFYLLDQTSNASVLTATAIHSFVAGKVKYQVDPISTVAIYATSGGWTPTKLDIVSKGYTAFGGGISATIGKFDFNLGGTYLGKKYLRGTASLTYRWFDWFTPGLYAEIDHQDNDRLKAERYGAGLIGRFLIRDWLRIEVTPLVVNIPVRQGPVASGNDWVWGENRKQWQVLDLRFSIAIGLPNFIR